MNNPDNTPLIQFADTRQTMTSLEIAEVIGKPHYDVLKAIRKMEPAWKKVTAGKFSCCMRISELANGVKKENPYYVLTKTETLYIATKFNDEARARLVLRWEQLEHEHRPAQTEPAQPEPAPSVMQQPSRRQILLMALQAEEECQRLRGENDWLRTNMLHLSLECGRRWQLIEQYVPDAVQLLHAPGYTPQQEGAQRLLTASATTERQHTYTATQLAAEYGMKAIGFNNLLQQLGIQHNTGGCWAITPDYAGRGYTLTKQITVHDEGQPRRKPFMVWTEQGRRFIHDTLSRQGIQPTGKKGGES